MILMDGKKIAEEKMLLLKEKIKREEISLSLAVIQVGDNPVSNIYIRNKKERLEDAGITVNIYKLKEDISTEKLREKIAFLKEDGVIIQLPLPKHINKEDVVETILPEKDVDCMLPFSFANPFSKEEGVLPPVVSAVATLLKEYNIKTKGKNVVLIGAGDLVGKPLSLFFIKKKATVSVLNKETKERDFFTKDADIIVSGAGVPSIIKSKEIKKGVVLIDAGTSSLNGNIKGDIDIKEIEDKASLLAPVPGGVGPLTIYYLAYNLLYLKDKKTEYRDGN